MVAARRTAALVAAALTAAALGASGCGAARSAPPARPRWPDAPAALRDEAGRAAAIDQLWVIPPGAERAQARAAIAAAVARRIAEALDDRRPLAAEALLDQLLAPWQAEPAAVGRGLAPHLDLLRALRAAFARSGALAPAARALIVLAEVDAPSRAAHLAELDELLAFADQLAVAEHGPDARRGPAIALLGPTAAALPLPWLVDRYVALLTERQVAIAGLLASGGASMALVRAHADVIATSRRIAIALARAGRPGEIHGRLGRLRPGIGAAAEGRDRELRIAAELVAEQPTADAFLELASRLRSDEHAADPAAALAALQAGLARHPGDPALLAAAGTDARALGRVELAIQLLEGALGAGALDAPVALRLGRLYGERITRLTAADQPQAAVRAWQGVLRFTAGAARRHPHPVWQQAAAVAEAALGAGLAGLGLVDEGRRALAASLERAPSIDAFDALARIAGALDRPAEVDRWVRGGLGLLGDTTAGDRYHRARLERFAADALRRAGRRGAAAAGYLDALRTWASLGEVKELPREIAAERMLDSGRAMWWLGDAERAVELVLAATERAPAAPEVAAGAGAFLIEIGRYRDALDACHRGLAEPAVPELQKIYTSLQILGEARRLGEPPDRLASDFLAGRRGELWPERLAQAATGQLPYAALRAAAATGPERGELAFYGAVLGLDPAAATPAGRRRLLQEVVAARAVFTAEYALARAYLGPPQAPVADMQGHDPAPDDPR